MPAFNVFAQLYIWIPSKYDIKQLIIEVHTCLLLSMYVLGVNLCIDVQVCELEDVREHAYAHRFGIASVDDRVWMIWCMPKCMYLNMHMCTHMYMHLFMFMAVASVCKCTCMCSRLCFGLSNCPRCMHTCGCTYIYPSAAHCKGCCWLQLGSAQSVTRKCSALPAAKKEA